MARVPTNPKIYHITHVRNLPQIVEAGVLWSDAKRIDCGLDCDVVGMAKIKRRRLEEIEVACHPGTRVGEYVPFYFCPRSIMLYMLHMGNHPDLDYHEGQRPIVHLQADLVTVVEWAKREGRRWAFSDRNAGAYYVDFYSDVAQLDQVNWEAVATNQWREASVKEGKQAEFLIHESFPWELVERVGVVDPSIERQVNGILASVQARPTVIVERGWYY